MNMNEVVKRRVDRLYRGEFEAMFGEAIVSAEASGPRGGQADRVRRAVELAHLGKVSKALGALTSGGILPLEEQAVYRARRVHHPAAAVQLEPPEEWRAFVVGAGGAAPSSDVYKFELGECDVLGPSGHVIRVDTLKYALQQLDSTAAAGMSGLGFDLLKHMSPDTVRPLLRVYFGQGRWDYSRRVDGEEDGPAYHAELHALLVSVRGIALDKDGSGFEHVRAVNNIRPLGCGGAERRLAAQCQLLQLKSDVGIKLAENGQYGAGFKNGADTVYHLVSESMDAMVASMVAGGAAQTDARNAFCSIHRAAMQRGILLLAPELLPAFDFLYGPNVTGSCYYYGGGGPEPMGSCLLHDGVSPVFGPLFFSTVLD